MIFDTHAHYDDEAFDADRETLLARMPGEGIGRIVNMAAAPESIDRCLDLAHRYSYIYCALGIHPENCAGMTEELLDEIRGKLSDEKAVAVGEIGLDYYWPEPDPALQRRWFERQLDLAREADKPVVIHSRNAAADTLRILQEKHAEDFGGVIHCYSYSVEMAREFIKMGFYIGVGGVVTFKNARKLVEVVDNIPLERIVLETDCPYLSPVPHRGERNCSLNLPLVAEKVAQIKGTTADEVAGITWRNAEKLYRMKPCAMHEDAGSVD